MGKEEIAKDANCIELDRGDRVYYIQYKPGDTIIINIKESLSVAQVEQMERQLPEGLGTKVIVIQGCEIASIGVASKTDADIDDDDTEIELVGGKTYKVPNKESGKKE